MNGDGVTRYIETAQNATTDVLSKFLDLHILTYESFLGFGFEAFLIGVVAALTFGAITGSLTIFSPVVISLFLFVSYAVPLTGSTHYDPRLGMLTSAIFILALRASQVFLGIAPATGDFITLALLWGAAQVFLIGYLPGKIIPTSEHLGFLVKGMTVVALLYTTVEYFVLQRAMELGLSGSVILAFPFWSLLLIAGTSSVATFIFANTFCPYMMIPIMSKSSEARYCGSGNFIFDFGTPLKLDRSIIEQASKRGFKLISELPAVTVFTCPRGGMISVYNSGKVLIRKVNKGTANRLYSNLALIIKNAAAS